MPLRDLPSLQDLLGKVIYFVPPSSGQMLHFCPSEEFKNGQCVSIFYPVLLSGVKQALQSHGATSLAMDL